MSKNHDFGLYDLAHTPMPKLSAIPYLVLYRNFLETVTSGYEKRVVMKKHQSDTREAWHEFSQQRLIHYRRFVQKWVIEEDGCEKLKIRYEDIMGIPLATCTSIVRFSLPSEEPDLPRLQRLIDEADRVVPNSETRLDYVPNSGIRGQRNIEAFRYFDPKYFATLERQLARELSLLGYPQRYGMASGLWDRWRLHMPGLSWLKRRR